MSYGLDDLQCQWLGLLQGNHGKFEKSVWGGFMFSIVWTIWNVRNNLIFEEQKPIWEDILWHLFYFAAGWIRNLNSFFWYTGVDLYRNHECISAWSEGNVRECPIVEEEPNADAARFFDLLKDSNEPLWDGCMNHSKLSAVA
jgi:hypothetical protein